MGRPPKAYSQAGRLTAMIRSLASRACTVDDLRQEFGISRRQVYRDLVRIEEEGHPLTQTKDGLDESTWQLPLNYKGLPPVTLSPYELMSLYLAKNHLAYLKDTPFLDDLDGVIAKVRAGLPLKTINHLDRIIEALVPWQRPMRSYKSKKGVIANLRRALLLQRRITMTYRKPDAERAVAYRVDPYVLVPFQAGLYLVGRSHRSRAVRTFAVERMQRVVVTDDLFDIPRTFSGRSRMNRLFGIMDDEPPQAVRIRFSPDVAHLFKERRWHPSQKVKPLKNGAALVTFQTGGLKELTSWVLAWGNQAEVLAPPALRKAVADELFAAAKPYRSSR